MRDNCESNILCADADRGRAVDRDAHALRFSLPKCLRHQYVRYLRRSDSERVCAERTVSRCMAVATHNKQPGQGQALLGTDDMHDALARITQTEQSYAAFSYNC